jgi:glycosyltransferase involved in cell wall biosynthesis
MEVISDNENGFLFETENSNDLADKLIQILADKKNLEIVRKKGAELINTKYGWDEIGRLTKSAYETL